MLKLKILGPRYYPIRFKQNFDFNELRNILLTELLVKQKNGYFSYSDDPKDEKAFNVRNFLNKIIIPHKITPNLLEQITNEEHINMFAKMLNKSNENKLESKTNRLLKLIYESVVQETFDFVGMILLLDKEASSEPTSQFIQQIKLVESFYRSLKVKSKKSILSQEFLLFITNSLEAKLNGRIKRQRDLVKCYIADNFSDGMENLIHFCVFNEISKSDLEYFTNFLLDAIACEKFTDLFKTKSANVQIDKQLKLYELFRN